MQKKKLSPVDGVPREDDWPRQPLRALEQFDDADLPAMNVAENSNTGNTTCPHAKFVTAAYLKR
jgi:hypothetical protein